VLKKMKCKKWLADESGVTAIEYSLISGAMALVLVPALNNTSSGIAQLYTTITDLFDF
jgi:Flp pilus assembly pilin Flp